MKIWITRHGQTRLNKARLMQGLTDEPLNETGIMQAKKTREMIGDVHFDAVYASPLNRAIMTGSIIGGVDPSEVIIDPRIIEADFGKYEQIIPGATPTGIANFAKNVEKVPAGIYNMKGQLVRYGNSLNGLAKGLYIIGGKKVVIR